jgi:hypothetical protein
MPARRALSTGPPLIAAPAAELIARRERYRQPSRAIVAPPE